MAAFGGSGGSEAGVYSIKERCAMIFWPKSGKTQLTESYVTVQQKLDINNSVSLLEAEHIHFSFTTFIEF